MAQTPADLIRILMEIRAAEQVPPAHSYVSVNSLTSIANAHIKNIHICSKTYDAQNQHFDNVELRTLRQREFAAGRACAKEAISRCLNIRNGLPLCDSAVEMVGTGAHGEPLFPSGICGSISHKRGWAIALATTDPIVASAGIDLEQMFSLKQAKKLENRILREDEILLDRQPEQITLAFSAKEALFKALYPITQNHFGFHDFLIKSITYNKTNTEVSVGTLVIADPTQHEHQLQFAHCSKHCISTSFIFKKYL